MAQTILRFSALKAKPTSWVATRALTAPALRMRVHHASKLNSRPAVANGNKRRRALLTIGAQHLAYFRPSVVLTMGSTIVIQKILTHLDKKSTSVEASRLPPCRGPPQAGLFD